MSCIFTYFVDVLDGNHLKMLKKICVILGVTAGVVKPKGSGMLHDCLMMSHWATLRVFFSSGIKTGQIKAMLYMHWMISVTCLPSKENIKG